MFEQYVDEFLLTNKISSTPFSAKEVFTAYYQKLTDFYSFLNKAQIAQACYYVGVIWEGIPIFFQIPPYDLIDASLLPFDASLFKGKKLGDKVDGIEVMAIYQPKYLLNKVLPEHMILPFEFTKNVEVELTEQNAWLAGTELFRRFVNFLDQKGFFKFNEEEIEEAVTETVISHFRLRPESQEEAEEFIRTSNEKVKDPIYRASVHVEAMQNLKLDRAGEHLKQVFNLPSGYEGRFIGIDFFANRSPNGKHL